MTPVLSDIRFALRGLRRRPLFTAVVVGTVALGVGSASAVFSVVNGVLLRPLPYGDPGRLVTVWQTFPHWRGQPVLDGFWDQIALSWEDYTNLRAAQSSYRDIGAYYARRSVVGELGETDELLVAAGSVSLLELLGVRMELGRWFGADEEGGESPWVAVLSHEAWVTRSSGSPEAPGQTIRIDGQPFTVIGVLPAGFALDALGPTVDRQAPLVWRPIGSLPGDVDPASNNYETIARLAARVPLERAEAETQTILRGDRDPAHRGARVLPRLETETGVTRRPLLLLLGATGLLLLLACTNIAALLLGEAASREREVATRVALGAGRWHVARQLLTESVTIAALGGILGAMLGFAITRAFLTFAPAVLPRQGEVTTDVRVLIFCAAAALFTGVSFGVAPALSLSGRDVSLARYSGFRSTLQRSRAQAVLIAGQVALCLVLLFAAGVLSRSLLALSRVDLGFDAKQLLTIRLRLSPAQSDPVRFAELATERLRSIPGIVAVTATSSVPFSGMPVSQSVEPGEAGLKPGSSQSAQRDIVLAGHFETLHIPVLQGRTFLATEAEGAPLVTVVNKTMARRFWPTESALGKRFRAPPGVLTIVGVVDDIRHSAVEQDPVATFYVSLAQLPTSRLSLMVRTEVDPRRVANAVRQALRALDDDMPIVEMVTMDSLLARSLIEERYRTVVVSLFSALATLIAVVGVAGVAARAIGQSMRELGIRAALGATSLQIVQLICRQGMMPVLMGIVLDTIGAAAVGRMLAAYLFDVGPADPATLAMAAILLLALSMSALLAQARRAARPDLSSVLRGE